MAKVGRPSSDGEIAAERKKLKKISEGSKKEEAQDVVDYRGKMGPNSNAETSGARLRGDQAAFFKIFNERVSFVSSNILSTRSCKSNGADHELPPFLISNLKRINVRYFFPIQKELLTRLGHVRNYSSPYHPGDIYVCTHTGSGKTLSYAVPIVKLLSERATPVIRALVLAPTWGLADQIYKVFVSLLEGSSLAVGLATGGVKVNKNDCFAFVGMGINPSLENSDILVATPGTLIKCISHLRKLDLSHVEYLVVDEVDCLLDQNFGDWIKVVNRALGESLPERSYRGADIPKAMMFRGTCGRMDLTIRHSIHIRKLLFSATVSYDPAKLAALNLRVPVFISEKNLGKFTLPNAISEHMVLCPKSTYKPLSLLKIISDYNLSKTLVFVRSTEAAARLSKLVKIAYRLKIQELVSEKEPCPHILANDPTSTLCHAFSSDLLSKQRKKALSAFAGNKLRLLITTALMARGMDVKDIEAVINYDIPTSAKTYLHRVGRTGRAGKKGLTYTILLPSQVKWFKTEMKNIERDLPITRIAHSNFEPALPLYTQALSELQLSVCTEPEKKMT